MSPEQQSSTFLHDKCTSTFCPPCYPPASVARNKDDNLSTQFLNYHSFDHATSPYPLHDTWANYGATTVHVSAPGANIRSPVPAGLQKSAARWAARLLPLGAGFFETTGTSAAAAHAASLAALVWSFRPFVSPQSVRDFLVVSGTESDLAYSGKLLSSGRLSASLAMANAASLTASTPPTSTVVQTIAFSDTEGAVGLIAGDVILSLAQNNLDPGTSGQTSAQEIKLFFLDNGDTILGEISLGTSCDVVNLATSVTCTLPGAGVAVPGLRVSKIAAYPARTGGIAWSLGAATAVLTVSDTLDAGSVGSEFAVSGLSISPGFEDDNKETGEARVRIQFTAPKNEQGILEYRVYQADDTGEKVGGVYTPVLARINKKGLLDTPVVSGSSAMEVESHSEGVEIRNLGGYSWSPDGGGNGAHSNYTNDVDASTTIKGPGVLYVNFLDLEEDFDWVRVSGKTVLTGKFNQVF